MRTTEQQVLRMYVRTREDFQAMRKRIDNRLGKKADGKIQKIQDERNISTDDIENFIQTSDQARQQEKNIEKMLKKALEKFPVYNEWLKDVKGVGEVSAGWLLGEFDIHEATTVSKMWQYAGLNPGLVRGKKRITKKDYKPSMGKIIREIENIKSKGTDYIIETDHLVKGDKPTEGFVLPYNKNLKSFLLGVLATQGFIMQQNNYAVEFYYPRKTRLEKEESIIENNGRPGKDDGKMWKDASPGHRDNAAKRYMIKMFLKDLYAVWREIEGLPVRCPYEEEYLAVAHHNI